MEPGDADVVEAVDVVAHELGGARGFFGDRQVRRAGRGDEDRALARRDVLLAERDDGCIGVIRRVRHAARAPRRRRPRLARVTSSVEPRPTISAAMRGDLGRRFA